MNSLTGFDENNNERARLRRLLAKLLEIEGLRGLVFDIGYDFDELAGETKSAKIRALLLRLIQEERIDQFITYLQRKYPAINWRIEKKHGVEGKVLYPGLRLFREHNSDCFFGREDFLEQLVSRIKHNALTIIVGASGCGKSSLLFAGLVPILNATQQWNIISCRPGKDPFMELSSAMVPILEPNLSALDLLGKSRQMAGMLRENAISIADVVTKICKQQTDNRHSLVIVDQFEELYTKGEQDNDVATFISQLLNTCQNLSSHKDRSESKFALTVAIRSGLVGKFAAYSDFTNALLANALELAPLKAGELKQAIAAPVAPIGGSFEQGLVDRIISDLIPSNQHAMDSDNLPLLAFALEQLWDLRSPENVMTHRAYEVIGQVGGAIQTYADEIYEGLDEPSRLSIRRVMVQMTKPSGESDNSACTVLRSNFDDDDWETINRLAEDRLVVMDRDQNGNEIAEIIHESLIQRWDKMTEWMSQDRNFRLWQERVRMAYTQWLRSLSNDDLIFGSLLIQSQTWIVERPKEIRAFELDYIRRSIAANEASHDRLAKYRILAGTVGSGMVTAAITAVVGYVVWSEPASQSVPRIAFAFIMGVIGIMLGGIQGALATTGTILVERRLTKPTLLWRAFVTSVIAGVIGAATFGMMYFARMLPPEVTLLTSLVTGLLLFAPACAAAAMGIPKAFGQYTSKKSFVQGLLMVCLASFLGILLAYFILDTKGATPFWPTAFAFTALEGAFVGGMHLGFKVVDLFHFGAGKRVSLATSV